MFNTSYTAGGRLDSPHYPSYQAPYMVGISETIDANSVQSIEYDVNFRGELYAVSIDTNKYYNDDCWTLYVNDEPVCENIFVKRAPEGINLMAFIEVGPGDKIKIDFTSQLEEKVVWATLHFLKEGDFSKPPELGDAVSVQEEAIRLYIFDYGGEDGDRLSVYVNGAKIVEDFYCYNMAPFPGKNGKNYIEIPLSLGLNNIVFEGVSAGAKDSPLSARFYVMTTGGEILYSEEELPSLRMTRRPGIDPEEGEFAKPLPTVTWSINRTV